MKAIEQYFHVVLFIMLYKVALTFKSVHETLVCDHSIEAIEQYFLVVLFVMLYFYSETNSTGATQRFLANHMTCSEQKNWSSFISN